jgi:hypothetical protein
VEVSPQRSEGGFDTKSKEKNPLEIAGFLLKLVLQIIGKTKLAN